MNPSGSSKRRRMLIIDDTESVHASFRTLFEKRPTTSSFAAAKAALLSGTPGAAMPAASGGATFDLDFALQGREGVDKAAKARLNGDPYLVAFVDMRMPPGWDGATTIKHLWEVDPDMQVVVCTAFADQPLDQLADELGNVHQLLILKKPFDTVEVKQVALAMSEKRLAHQAATMRMEELERLVQERTSEIEHALLHDKLTGLPNRTLLMARLEACLQRRLRHSDSHFAVLFLDFDRFKLVNDSLGHELGDLLLIEIANRLRISLRGADLLCHASLPSRFGGDEFIVLLEDLREVRDAGRVAQRLVDTLSEPYTLENQKLVVTVSVGVATSDRAYERAGDMLRDADIAMYRAKAAGRARYVMFDAAMHEEVAERLFLETAMRQAVRDDTMTLHYQPIVRLADGAFHGFEALVRWTLPERGPISASTIISIAEDTGLILPLTIQLLRQACRRLQDWRARFPAAHQMVMSVNFSRRLVLDPDIVDKLADIITEAGVEPGAIVLEITESALLNDTDAAALFGRLRRLGFWLHLDDFGTGYSSLSCLYTLPLSGLKIDRAFLQKACAHPEQSAVLSAIVSIARALDLSLVVEGVETTEQIELLRSLGADLGQGYLFGAPCDAQHAEAVFHCQPTLCYT